MHAQKHERAEKCDLISVSKRCIFSAIYMCIQFLSYVRQRKKSLDAPAKDTHDTESIPEKDIYDGKLYTHVNS